MSNMNKKMFDAAMSHLSHVKVLDAESMKRLEAEVKRIASTKRGKTKIK